MTNLTQLALRLAAAFVLAITPGARRLYVVARSLAGGRPNCVQYSRRHVGFVPSGIEGRTAARPGLNQRLRERSGRRYDCTGSPPRYGGAAGHISLAPERFSILAAWYSLCRSGWVGWIHLRSFRLADECLKRRGGTRCVKVGSQ